MRTRSMLFLMALLGIFGSGRGAAAADSGSPQTGVPSARKDVPPIDAAVPAKIRTATFALG